MNPKAEPQQDCQNLPQLLGERGECTGVFLREQGAYKSELELTKCQMNT